MNMLIQMFLIAMIAVERPLAASQGDDQMIRQPPPSPAKVEIIADSVSMRDECIKKLGSVPLSEGWKLLGIASTVSKRWGKVWRADFSTPNALDSDFINRIVCWKGEDGMLSISVLLGQRLARLPIGAP